MDSEARAFLVEHMTSLETAEKWYLYSLPTRAFRYFSIEQLRREVTSSGSHFFDRDAMRFFRSRVHGGMTGMIGGRFFITSEQLVTSDGHEHPRAYSVRWVYKWEGSKVLQVDRFTDRFTTLDQARRFAHKAHSVLPFPGSDEQ